MTPLLDFINVRPVFPTLPTAGDDHLRRFHLFPLVSGDDTAPQLLDLSGQLINFFSSKFFQNLKLKREKSRKKYSSRQSWNGQLRGKSKKYRFARPNEYFGPAESVLVSRDGKFPE